MYEGIEVNKIFTHSGNVHGVETTRGTINCEYFINCGGLVNVTAITSDGIVLKIGIFCFWTILNNGCFFLATDFQQYFVYVMVVSFNGDGR